MTPLIDGDILLHEIGWSCQFKDKDTKEEILLDFDKAIEFVEDKIRVIKLETKATENPILFITDSEWITSSINREQKLFTPEKRIYIPNFRLEKAKTKPYKGNRKTTKPFHFYNLIAYFRSEYKTIISDNGYEADDELAMYQVEQNKLGIETIICSRDKDLRMVPGWHYSWECGKQHSIGPEYVNQLGSLIKKDSGNILGYGSLFFYYQMLTGDSVDNIPGLPMCGPVNAYNILRKCTSTYEAFLKVKEAYVNKIGKEKAKEYFKEQADLLWIIQERGKHYEFPTEK